MNSDAMISLSPAQIYTVYAIAVVSCVVTFVGCLMRGMVVSLATTLAEFFHAAFAGVLPLSSLPPFIRQV